jgi:GNAT superfamily N-acetyltransferase
VGREDRQPVGPSPRVELRPACAADLEYAYQVKKAAEGDLVRAVFGWDEAVQRDYQKEDFYAKRPSLIVVDGAAVGTVALIETGGWLEIGQFFILPEHQHKGIGSRVLEDALQDADSKHMPARLTYLRGNRAEALYRRYGFTLVGQTETHRYMERAPAPCSAGRPTGRS